MGKRHSITYLALTFFGSVIFLIITWVGYADEGIDMFKRISGSFGTPHTIGTFTDDGNGGTMTFMNTAEESSVTASGVYLDTVNNTLSGIFFLETAGWTSLGLPGYPVTLTPPGGNTGNIIDPWMLSGYGWSDNAGWITLDALNSSYSGAYYVPATKSFTGFAWSDALGFLTFAEANSLDFLGKVKVLGNIAGNKTFDILYSLGNKFDSITMGPFMNTVHKNVALLVRGVPATKINTTNTYVGITSVNALSTDTIYFSLSGTNAGKYVIMGGGTSNLLSAKKARSLIIEGADLYINGDVPQDVSVKSARAIIVLKDRNGNGGNIYIHGSVKTIFASVIAEGSIFSGYPTSPQTTLPITTYLYNDTKAKVTNLPANQLYIYGTVISRNTIGGAAESETSGNGSCPHTVKICDRDTSIKYDFNYFRTFSMEPERRAYKDSTYDAYSIVIEYDPRLLESAPPGLAQ